MDFCLRCVNLYKNLCVYYMSKEIEKKTNTEKFLLKGKPLDVLQMYKTDIMLPGIFVEMYLRCVCTKESNYKFFRKYHFFYDSNLQPGKKINDKYIDKFKDDTIGMSKDEAIKKIQNMIYGIYYDGIIDIELHHAKYYFSKARIGQLKTTGYDNKFSLVFFDEERSNEYMDKRTEIIIIITTSVDTEKYYFGNEYSHIMIGILKDKKLEIFDPDSRGKIPHEISVLDDLDKYNIPMNGVFINVKKAFINMKIAEDVKYICSNSIQYEYTNRETIINLNLINTLRMDNIITDELYRSLMSIDEKYYEINEGGYCYVMCYMFIRYYMKGSIKTCEQFVELLKNKYEKVKSSLTYQQFLMIYTANSIKNLIKHIKICYGDKVTI